METIRVRNAVLGGGVMGTAAAYHLAKRGEPVTLVEQFRIGHDRGSSHGAARIARHSYTDPADARLMIEVFRAWRELEADAGRSLFFRSGGVSFGPPSDRYVGQVADSLAEVGIPHRRMSGAEWNAIAPAFSLRNDDLAVFEPDAGVLAASRVVRVQAELATQLGGDRTTRIEGCAVRRIDLEGTRPVLIADDLHIHADRLIIAAGPWAGRLVPALTDGLQVTRQPVVYFEPPDPTAYTIGALPIFIFKGAGDEDIFYGMPDFQGTGVKVAIHAGPTTDPDSVDREVREEEVQVVRNFVARFLPGLARAPVRRTEVCLYTVAPDDRFLVDFWPGRRDVIVASPCSGHGFKFGNLIGRILADLALDGATDLPVERWRIG